MLTKGLRVGLLTAGLVIAGGTFVAAAAQETTVKIAVVDLERVIAQSKAGQALQSKLEAFQQQIKSEGDALNEEARSIRQRLADGVNTLAEDKIAELQKQYEDKQIELRRFRDDKTREGQKMQEEGLRVIEKQLQPVFEQVRDEGGYDLILNYVPGVVVMAGERVDITQKVVDTLNATEN
jgi:Skp family chaperone for outer membrane proteins